MPVEATTGRLADAAVTLAWMFLPVLCGYASWRAGLSRQAGGERLARAMSRWATNAALLFAAPPLFVLVFWVTPLPADRAVLMPVLGLLGLLLGGAAALLLTRGCRFTRASRGGFFLCGASSNMFSFGSIVALLLIGGSDVKLGEAAVAELALYRVFESPFYFLVAWPIAARLAEPPADEGGGDRSTWFDTFRRTFKPVTLVPILGIIIGWTLNVTGTVRPLWCDGIAPVLVKLNASLLGFMVGLTLRRAAPLRMLKRCLKISAVKFLILPVTMVSLAAALGLTGQSLQVVLICTSMPVAFFAVVGAALFGLDEEMVGSLWLFTTGSMLLVVPILSFLIPALGAPP